MPPPSQMMAGPAELFLCFAIPAAILAVLTSVGWTAATGRPKVGWGLFPAFAVAWFVVVGVTLLAVAAYEDRRATEEAIRQAAP